MAELFFIIIGLRSGLLSPDTVPNYRLRHASDGRQKIIIGGSAGQAVFVFKVYISVTADAVTCGSEPARDGCLAGDMGF